jgi:hypothetical protein
MPKICPGGADFSLVSWLYLQVGEGEPCICPGSADFLPVSWQYLIVLPTVRFQVAEGELRVCPVGADFLPVSWLYLIVLPTVSFQVAEGEPRICPGGADGQLQRQLIGAHGHAHQVLDDHVQVDAVASWRMDSAPKLKWREIQI